MPTTDVLRPRDGDALRAELRQIVASSAVPVVFGGEVSAGNTLYLSEFHGTRTKGLDGLLIPSRSGLGGRVLDQQQPAAVSDYGSSQYITHDYDRPVLGEGLRSILAVPVVVAGASRAVMYAAVRERGPIGDRIAEMMVKASRRLSHEIAIRDEVDMRLRLLESSAGAEAGFTGHSAATAELRDIYAELRTLASTTSDASTRAELRMLSDRMSESLRSASLRSADRQPDTEVRLSVREIDVLAQIALGCTNAETAQRLSLGPETVKSYLRTAMNKTGARTRYEAVVTARRRGLLP